MSGAETNISDVSGDVVHPVLFWHSKRQVEVVMSNDPFANQPQDQQALAGFLSIRSAFPMSRNTCMKVGVSMFEKAPRPMSLAWSWSAWTPPPSVMHAEDLLDQGREVQSANLGRLAPLLDRHEFDHRDRLKELGKQAVHQGGHCVGSRTST